MPQEDLRDQLQGTQHFRGCNNWRIVWDLNKGSDHREQKKRSAIDLQKGGVRGHVTQDGEAFLRKGKMKVSSVLETGFLRTKVSFAQCNS